MNQPPRLIHHFVEYNAACRPEKTALVHDEVRIGYGELNALSNGLAWRLLDRGVLPGDRVVLFMENGLQYVVAHFAALKAGAVAVPVCSELTPQGLGRLLLELEPAALISSGKQERVMAASGLGAPIIVCECAPAAGAASFISWGEILGGKPADNPQIPMSDEALGSIIFTSGSTGQPKGVMLSHRNIIANARSIISYLHLEEEDIQMVVLPFYYVMGMSLLTTHFAVGGTLVINNRFAFTALLIEQMVAEKVTGFSGVPSTYSHLLHRSPLADCRERLRSLRYCTQAGGHLPRRTKEELLAVLPGHTRFFAMYGATEASARLAYVDPQRLREKMDSIGTPIPGVSLAIRDESGRELPDGEVGEIVAQGPNIMQGYWRDPVGTAKVLDHHGYHTGDIGYRDTEGYFYVLGRKDNLLKIGGHRINPKEVEDALMGTELLEEVAVLGISDNMLEPRLVAVAAPKFPGCSEKEILRCCVKALPKYKMPSAVKLVGSLPKTPHGKLDGQKCRELARNCLLQAGYS